MSEGAGSFKKKRLSPLTNFETIGAHMAKALRTCSQPCLRAPVAAVCMSASGHVWTAPSFFAIRRRHTRSISDWSSDVCSSDLEKTPGTEDLEPVAWTGDHGLTLLER